MFSNNLHNIKTKNNEVCCKTGTGGRMEDGKPESPLKLPLNH
jgi:hypothetical protein